MPRLRILLAFAAAALAGCIGPSGSHREGYKSPTAPTHEPNFTLLGRVVAAGTGAPIQGAKIDVGISSGVTDGEGRYNLPGLRGTFFQIVTSAEGFDTLRVPVMPFDGNVQVNMTLTPSVPFDGN